MCFNMLVKINIIRTIFAIQGSTHSWTILICLFSFIYSPKLVHIRHIQFSALKYAKRWYVFQYVCQDQPNTYTFCNRRFNSVMNNFDILFQVYLVANPCPHSSHSVFSSVIWKALIFFAINLLSSTWYVEFLQ